MISNNHIDKDINKNEGKVIQLAHNADKNNHTGKAAKLDVVKQNYNNKSEVAGNRSTEHPSSDIHKTVDKTVKTKEKASTPSKENKLGQSKMLPKTGETTSSQSWWGLYALLGMLALFIPKFRKESK